MKTISLLIAITFFGLIGFAQNVTTSTSMTLPNVVAADGGKFVFGEPNQNQAVSVDELFDKVALIESILFSVDEVLNKHEEHMLKGQEVRYFESF